MSGSVVHEPGGGATPSQTIGPFFRFGLDWLQSPHLVEPGTPGAVVLAGTVVDGDGAAVPDAMVELWQGRSGSFGRYLVGAGGDFTFTLVPGGPLDVTLFARGLLNRLVTRVWLPGDPAFAADPVLAAVPEERRSTLVAVAEGDARYRWDIRLQGGAETVFLVW